MTINYFVPARAEISSITRADPGVVTTTSPHGYSSGLYVRLNIQKADGMQQANGTVYLIAVIDTTSFAISANTTKFDEFVASESETPSQVIPVGEVSESLAQAIRNNNNILPQYSWINT